MLAFTIRRSMQSVVVLFAMSLIVFMGIYAIGNPVDILISPEADIAEQEATIHRLGLDKPIWAQYWLFLINALHGDLGNSFVHNEEALDLIFQRLPATMELAVFAVGLAVVLGIPLGLIAGFQPKSFVGKAIMAGSILGFSLPTFWVGLMFILFFSVMMGWLPASGRGQTVDLLGIPVSFLTLDGLSHLFLPALNLSLFKLSMVIRLTRSGTQDVLLQDYIKFARAKGLSPSRIVGVHVLKNILIPIITVMGLQFGTVIAFAVVTESIYAWPGIGKLLIESISYLDRPVVVAYLLLTVVMFIIINFVVDILYTVLDPRVRLDGAK